MVGRRVGNSAFADKNGGREGAVTWVVPAVGEVEYTSFGDRMVV